MEQLRQANKRQDERRKSLLDYQLQKNQQKQTPTSNQSGDSQQSKRAKRKQAEKEINSIVIDPSLRPVILGLIDFKPIFDSESKLTPAGNSIKVKKAARALAVENLFEIDTSEELIGELDWINATISNITQTKAFLDSLDVESNLSIYDEAMSAFELDSATASEASNTEILYTFIRDYAYSMTCCTPRLLECADRDFDSEKGRKLTAFPRNKANLLRKGLRSITSFSDYVTSRLPSDDSEVNLRYILAGISRELLLSYNTNAKGITLPGTLRYRDGVGTSGYGFCDWVAVSPTASDFKPVKSGPLMNKSNLHGIVGVAPNNTDSLFPFEPAELISSENNELSAKSTLDKIYDEIEPTAETGPYAGISSKWSDNATIIEDILDSEDLEMNNSPGYEILELICREIILKCLEALPSDGNGSASTSDATQIAFLTAAGKDDNALRCLIVYLCFLQDQLSGTAITGEQLNPAALSAAVKKDDRLYSILDDEPANSSKRTTYANVPESTVNLNPELEGRNSDINSSINSFFGMSFEEACEWIAITMRHSFARSTTAVSDDLSDKTAVSLDTAKDVLMGLATSGDSIFAELLTLIDSVKSLFLNGSFDEIGLTRFTKAPAANIHIALIAATAKVAYFILDDLIQNEGNMSSQFQTGGEKSSTRSLIGQAGQLAKMGPRMAMSWGSAGKSLQAPGGQSVKYSYAGVGAVRDSLTTFLNSEEQDVSALEEVSSVIARSFTALDEEHKFSLDFISSINDYVNSVADNYSAVVQTVISDIDVELEGTQSLNERIRSTFVF